jgi:AcrR family transcriptional regulator
MKWSLQSTAVGHKHTREEILAGALAVAFEVGLSRLSFGRVGKKLGISDRTVVYYFPTKDELVTNVVMTVGLELQATLDAAVSSSASDHLDLLGQAWPILARPETDPAFALFFEANGLAAAGSSPYDHLVPALVAAWIEWAASHIDGTPKHRRAEAEATVALADGLLLFRQLAGAGAADRAARRLGIR